MVLDNLLSGTIGALAAACATFLYDKQKTRKEDQRRGLEYYSRAAEDYEKWRSSRTRAEEARKQGREPAVGDETGVTPAESNFQVAHHLGLPADLWKKSIKLADEMELTEVVVEGCALWILRDRRRATEAINLLSEIARAEAVPSLGMRAQEETSSKAPPSIVRRRLSETSLLKRTAGRGDRRHSQCNRVKEEQ